MARFDSLRKLERNKKVIEFVKAHPDLSYREVAAELKKLYFNTDYHLSASRIWAITHPKDTRRKSQ